MTPEIIKEFGKVEFLGQRQDGTMDQLRDLVPFAAKLGLTSAVDAMSDSLSGYSSDTNVGNFAGTYPERLGVALNNINQLEESSMPKKDQILAAQSFASKLGLYDAADLLKLFAEKAEKSRAMKP